jgi:hypothetical protein
MVSTADDHVPVDADVPIDADITVDVDVTMDGADAAMDAHVPTADMPATAPCVSLR